jgi:regulatory protein YycI of two-component signal transduction system YycFG
MKNKIFIWAFIIVCVSLEVIYFGWSFAPGSYARAEIYEIELPEQELIEIINEI